MTSQTRSLSYDVFEFTPKQKDYCVAVFVINEGEKLLKQLDRMKETVRQADIVVADGGSTDGSTDHEKLESLGVNSLLVKTGPGKLGTQMRMAFQWALRRGYKGLVVVDGNGKDSVEDIDHFVQTLEEGFDHVQGSRFIPGGHHENTPLSRLIGLKILHVPLIRFFSGFPHTDTTNGFRAYSKKLLEDPKLDLLRDVFTGYELHYFIAVQAPKNGFRCTEIPVTRKYPAKGKIPTKISPLRGNLNVIKKLLAVCFGWYNVKK